MRQRGTSRLGEGQLRVFARCETQLGLVAGLPLRPDRLQEVCKQPVHEFSDEQVDAALLAQTSSPHGTGIVETERSLPDRAESGSLAESTAGATKHKPIGVAQARSIAATMLSANASGRERNG